MTVCIIIWRSGGRRVRELPHPSKHAPLCSRTVGRWPESCDSPETVLTAGTAGKDTLRAYIRSSFLDDEELQAQAGAGTALRTSRQDLAVRHQVFPVVILLFKHAWAIVYFPDQVPQTCRMWNSWGSNWELTAFFQANFTHRHSFLRVGGS